MGNKNSSTSLSNSNSLSNYSNSNIQSTTNYSQSRSLNNKSNFRSTSSSSSNSEPLPNTDYADDEPISENMLVPSSDEQTSEKPEEINVKNIVKLSLALKRKVVQSSSFNSQIFPMLCSLTADNLKTSKKAAIDLVCVIDHSGSMSGEKIELVKQTFDYLLNYLGDADRLSIVIFDDKASRLVPFLRTTEINKQKILSALRSVHGRGGTNINLGMSHAFQVLKQRRQANPVSSIFLLSDGLDGRAQDRVKQSLALANLPEDVTINTFGFGSDHDPQLMSDIAGLRDGSFYFIKELDTVDEAFVDCLGGLISAVAQSVLIKIEPVQSEALQGVKIVQAYGDASMWQKDGQTYITKISNLISGRQKDFVLELEIPANKKELLDHQKDVEVAKAEAEVVALDGQKVRLDASLHITLLNEVEEIKEQEEDDREVMKNFYRVKGASIINEARKLADQRKNEEAKKLLQNFKEELENSFLKGEEFIKNLIVDIQKTIEHVNPVVYEQVGKHEMMSNFRAQMHQKSNLTSLNCYQNEVQTEMLSKVRIMKSKK